MKQQKQVFEFEKPKFPKNTIFAWILIAIVLSMTVSALKDTTVDYINYRELVAGEAGVVYKIKITNFGSTTKTYELIPDANVIKQIGSYRIDPSSTVTIKPGKEAILYFYVTVNNGVQSRVEIPAKLVSGNERQDMTFTVRSIVPINTTPYEGTFVKFMKGLFYVIILAIFVVLLVIIFRKANKGKKKKDKDAEVETYY